MGCCGTLAWVIGRRVPFDSYVARRIVGVIGAHETSNVLAGMIVGFDCSEDLICVMGDLDLGACWASAYVSGPW